MKREKRWLQALWRRADFLAKRVAEGSANNKDLSWDKHELNALLWALGRLDDERARGVAVHRVNKSVD